tara:strand:+ start:129100 stop:129300 length:201 start_codon:yes stop_codon:yes gene_type:complete
MNCIVNGTEKELPDALTVQGLIELLGMGDGICAAEVDQKLVPKRERADVVLRDGQRVEIVSLIGGG